MDNFFEKYRIGILVSLLAHAIFVMLLLLLGLEAPFPPPPEKGIVIDLGVDSDGKGEKQVKKKKAAQKQAIQKPMETKVVKVSTTKNKTVTNKQAKIANLKTQIKNIEKQTKQIETKKYPTVPAVKKVNENALFPGASANTSKGVGNKSGNQGVKEGVQDAKNYDKGENLGAENINYNLAGRKVIALYKPINNSQAEGTVVIKIIVNSNGKVTNASFQEQGSTTSNPYLIQTAKKAAYNTVFNNGSKTYQKGTISYTFILE